MEPERDRRGQSEQPARGQEESKLLAMPPFEKFLIPRHGDKQDFRYEAILSIATRWLILSGCLIELNYRVEYGSFSHILNNLYVFAMMAANGMVHHRLRSRRRVSIVSLFLLSVMDVAALSFSVSLSGGFDSRYFVMYYPATAIFVLVFSPRIYGVWWTTTVAVIYVALCLTVSGGLDFQQQEEKVLFYRVLAMYGVVGFVSILTRFELMRRLAASERELEMRQERVETSQAIHDTVAQSVYLVGLGVETARDMARGSSNELVRKLDAVYDMSKLAMWELRRPIDSVHLFEARELREALSAHAYSFSAISGVPSEVIQEGEEPALPPLARSLLFSIAHNAMTNVLLHARANRVEVLVKFQPNGLRLTVSDDGIGMPGASKRSGHGIRNMTRNAERMGGCLEISRGIGGTGTSVTCALPLNPHSGGIPGVSDRTDQGDAG